MNVISSGTKCCERCGTPLYDFYEYDDGHGGIDGEITHEYCSYEDDICQDCLAEESEEEETENEDGSL